MANPDVSKLQEELFAARQAYAQAQRAVSDLTGQLQDSKEENTTLNSQLRQHQQTKEQNRQNAQKVDELEGHLAGKDAENKRLKGRNQLLQEELEEQRTKCDSKNLEASQAQGSVALHKSKLDEQAAQILMLKRQLLEMEEEVYIITPVFVFTLLSRENFLRVLLPLYTVLLFRHMFLFTSTA